jgi:lysozyme
MKRVPASGTVVRGCDIFHGDDESIERLIQAGNEFIIDKVTESVDYVDSKVLARWPVMKAAQADGRLIKVGLYHFYRPQQDPIAQAKWFVKHVTPLVQKGDLLNLDLEVQDGVVFDTIREDAYLFLNYVYQEMGIRCRIYGSPDFLQNLAMDARFLPYGLWIAEYGVLAPFVPAPFTNWDFFQYSDSGLDHDWFNGTAQELASLV